MRSVMARSGNKYTKYTSRKPATFLGTSIMEPTIMKKAASPMDPIIIAILPFSRPNFMMSGKIIAMPRIPSDTPKSPSWKEMPNE